MKPRSIILSAVMFLSTPALAQQQFPPSVNFTTELAKVASSCLNQAEKTNDLLNDADALATKLSDLDAKADAEQDAADDH